MSYYGIEENIQLMGSTLCDISEHLVEIIELLKEQNRILTVAFIPSRKSK